MKIGEACETGQIVKFVLGSSSKAAVYTTEDNCLRWKYRANGGDVPEDLTPAVHEFDTIMADIKRNLPKSVKQEAYVRLGKSLFVALNGNQYTEKVYDDIRSFVERLARQKARTLYVGMCIVVAIAISVIAFIVAQFLDSDKFIPYLYGGAFGAIGACISVMHRTNASDMDWRLSNIDLALQAVTRILLGYLFGVFFVMACMGDLVLGAIKSNMVALFVFSIISGFSERFIPELIQRLETKGVESV